MKWILDILKGLFGVNVNNNRINMFTRINNTNTTNYNVENGGTLNQIIVTDKETAEQLMKKLNRQPNTPKSASDDAETDNVNL